jgi:hydroxymethylglutaryl-CoA reductase (NADPH)
MAQPLAGNIENMIGYTRVPLGQAGLIKIFNSQFSNFKEYNLPLATTEGALVASVNRGCKATRLSDGIQVIVENVGVTRGPVFRVKNLAEGKKLIAWTKANFKLVQLAAAKTSSHLKLLDFKPQLLGKNVWLRFSFDTGEAMGMNMATIATEAIVKLIKKKLNIDCVALSGNYCVDKKPSWLNFVEGRGKKVWAEAVIKREVVKEVLKTTPEKIAEVVQKKQWSGSIMSGSIGANGHFANIAAALFLATGQDMAHAVEASMGVTTAELENNDLYFSVYLPDLMVGTVGGGTRLESPQQALKILGNPTAMELAGIIGGAVLAGELSLTAALASGELAKAHQKLGRAHAQ